MPDSPEEEHNSEKSQTEKVTQKKEKNPEDKFK